MRNVSVSLTLSLNTRHSKPTAHIQALRTPRKRPYCQSSRPSDSPFESLVHHVCSDADLDRGRQPSQHASEQHRAPRHRPIHQLDHSPAQRSDYGCWSARCQHISVDLPLAYRAFALLEAACFTEEHVLRTFALQFLALVCSSSPSKNDESSGRRDAATLPEPPQLSSNTTYQHDQGKSADEALPRHTSVDSRRFHALGQTRPDAGEGG